MKALILAGGKGTRLAPYTTVFPKPMLPIGKKPILEIIIKQLAYYGFKEIILSVGYLAELIQAYFQNNNDLPKRVKLSYVREKHPLGTAGPISLIPTPTEPVLVMNGDVLTTLDYHKLIEFHKINEGIVTIAMHKRKVKIDYGVLSTNGEGKIMNYNEKPTLDYLVSMGIYVFDPKALKYIEPNKKLDIPDLVKRLLAKGKKVQGYTYSDYWLDIGMDDDYEKAVRGFDKMEKKLLKQI